jgi:hypothetical protein
LANFATGSTAIPNYLHLLDDDALRHARTTERVGLHVGNGVGLVILLAGPSLVSSVDLELATSAET